MKISINLSKTNVQEYRQVSFITAQMCSWFLSIAFIVMVEQQLTTAAAERSRYQHCCEELQTLKIILGSEVTDCLQEECESAVEDLRSSSASNWSCTLSPFTICRHFSDLQEKNWRTEDDASADSQAMAAKILQIIEAATWHDCAIVYDISSMETMNRLIDSLSGRNLHFVTYDVTDWAEASDFFLMTADVFGRLQIKNIVLLTNITAVEKLFIEAVDYDSQLGRTSGLEMLTQWIVATPRSIPFLDRLQDAARGFDNVVVVSETAVKLTATTDTLEDSLVQCTMCDTESLLYKIINGTRSRQLQPLTELNVPFPNVKFFFNQRRLIVGTRRMPPFVTIPSADADESEFSGLCIDLLRELASSLNFTYELKLPVLHEGWGIEDDNRTWNGLVGLLHKKEVDLVVAPLSFTPDKSLVMETTVPYYHNNLAAVFKKRDPLLDKWRIYMRPFRGEVFLCLGVALIVETFLMHMLAWYDPTVYASKGNTHQHRIFPGPSPDDGFWHMFGVLLSQGGSTLPESCSGRILQAAWILFSIVIGATYSGNLIAFLTVEIEQKPFQTLGELLNQDVYTWGTFANAAVYTLLTESKNPVYRALGERLLVFARSDPGVISLYTSEQQHKVGRGNYALLVESSMAQAWTRENCDLSSVIDADVSFPYGVYLPKGSDYKELFNEFILRIWEANLASKWMENSLADSNMCVKNVVSDNPHIAVADVQSVLYVSIVGMVLALVALATEWLVFKNPRLRQWVTKAADAFVDGFQRRQLSDNDDASVIEDGDFKSSSDFPPGQLTQSSLVQRRHPPQQLTSVVDSEDEEATPGVVASRENVGLPEQGDERCNAWSYERFYYTAENLRLKREGARQGSGRDDELEEADATRGRVIKKGDGQIFTEYYFNVNSE